ncbi:MAG: hypothetical protein AB7L91_03410 [Dehalococcoidia bacterium]
MRQPPDAPGKDGRVDPDPYTVAHGMFRILGGGPGFMGLGGRRPAVDDPDRDRLEDRLHNSRRVLVGLALVALAAVAWTIMALVSASRGPDVRTLGDFETFARIIQDPDHERHFASVLEVETVVPFPILLPSAVDSESAMVTAYIRPPWRTDVDAAKSTYLAIELRATAGSLLYVQYAGLMEVMDVFRETGGIYRPSSFDPTRTATVPVATGAATLTELPARLGDPVLVLQWSLCGHGLALAALASEYPEAELIRIAESVPEQCN